MGKRYGPRNLQPLDGMAVGREGGREVQRVTIGKARYVQAYVKCGKPVCSRCVIGAVNFDRDRPGHGPYWFRHVSNPKGHTIRKYCGRDLAKYLEDVRTGKRRDVCDAAPEAPAPAEPAEPSGEAWNRAAMDLGEGAREPAGSIERAAREFRTEVAS